MASAKDIIVRVIPASVANPFVVRHHYSGKFCQNSQLHFGCFLDGQLHGVMSFGPSLQKRAMLSLVETDNKGEHAKWNEWLELNRMAFDDVLPRNSESRCLSIAFRLIKKNAPHIKWVVSYSDGTASGDGTIYRASGFKLTGIKRNTTILLFPDGERVAKNDITSSLTSRKKYANKLGIKKLWGGASVAPILKAGAVEAPGFQLRYIKLLQPDAKLLVPEIPFSKIDEVGAGMYLGQVSTRASRHKKKEPSEESPL